MEGAEPRPRPGDGGDPRLPVWIIEHVWARRTMEIQQVLDSSHWPEVDSQPLSLEDSWRLRVTSARVYAIMKNREVEHFERAVGFLEASYRLLPALVAPIKHMKIVFGLKTMLVMWMLRGGSGLLDALAKIARFFPSRLPQYQDQCSQREMFLMRKNHMDFKALAQTLAMDRDKRQDYMENRMEEQYGERYAQKVEDRLLHYLRQLEAALPGDTHVDKILKKSSPVTAEEKLLLDVVSSDSITIATTLKKLLHCDVACCRPTTAAQKSAAEAESCQNPVSRAASPKAPLGSEVLRGDEVARSVPESGGSPREQEGEVLGSRHRDLNLDSVIDVNHRRLALDVGKEEEEEQEVSPRSSGSAQDVASSPHFCSKHQRWVKSILRECPDECPEELQAGVSLSPPLFHSSSSSSQDLTPSDLIPCPSDPQTTDHLMSAVQGCEHGTPAGKSCPGSSGSANRGTQTETKPQPSSSRDTLLPAAMFSPVVRLIDIATVRGIWSSVKPPEASSIRFKQESTSGPQELMFSHTSGDRNSSFVHPEIDPPTNPVNAASERQTAAASLDASASCQPAVQQPFSKLSRKFRRPCATAGRPPAPDGVGQNAPTEQFQKGPGTSGTSPPASPAEPGASASLPPPVYPQSATKVHPQAHNAGPLASATSPCDWPAATPETSRVRGAQPRLSLRSQAVLLRSKVLQPRVSLTRLTRQEYLRLTEGSSPTRRACSEDGGGGDISEDQAPEEEGEDADSSFDVNTLYSGSSGSDGEDSRDPDYRPHVKKKRPLSESASHAGRTSRHVHGLMARKL